MKKLSPSISPIVEAQKSSNQKLVLLPLLSPLSSTHHHKHQIVHPLVKKATMPTIQETLNRSREVRHQMVINQRRPEAPLIKLPFDTLPTVLALSGSFLLLLGPLLLSSLLFGLMLILLPFILLCLQLLTLVLSLPLLACLVASRAHSRRRLNSRAVINDNVYNIVPLHRLEHEAIRDRGFGTNGMGQLTSSASRFGR